MANYNQSGSCFAKVVGNAGRWGGGLRVDLVNLLRLLVMVTVVTPHGHVGHKVALDDVRVGSLGREKVLLAAFGEEAVRGRGGRGR